MVSQQFKLYFLIDVARFPFLVRRDHKYVCELAKVNFNTFY